MKNVGNFVNVEDFEDDRCVGWVNYRYCDRFIE